MPTSAGEDPLFLSLSYFSLVQGISEDSLFLLKYQCVLQLRGPGEDPLFLSLSYFSLVQGISENPLLLLSTPHPGGEPQGHHQILHI
jgi:hypothetical protein